MRKISKWILRGKDEGAALDAGVSIFSISLKSSQLVYYPGQDIVGTVVIKLENVNEASDLVVKLVGKSRSHFFGRTGKHGRGHNAHTKVFRKQHTIMEHDKIMSTPSVGQHELEFCFNLPKNIPSSVEAPFGSIRYILSAHLGDSVVARSIIVNEIIDANSEKYKLGPRGEASDNVSSCCLTHGSVRIMGNLNRSCYCPGEAIRIGVDVTNDASRNTKPLTARLVQTIKYKTTERTKNIASVIASIKGPKIKKGESSHVWEGQPLGIPATVPTSSDIAIAVEYHVRIEVDVKHGGDLGLILPVTIGTIPHLQEEIVTSYGTIEQPEKAPASDVADESPVRVNVPGYGSILIPAYSGPIVIGDKGKSNASYDDDAEAERQPKCAPIYTFAIPGRLDGLTEDAAESRVLDDITEDAVESDAGEDDAETESVASIVNGIEITEKIEDDNRSVNEKDT